MIRSTSTLVACGLLGLASFSAAQNPPKEQGHMFFRSNVGSFKAAGSDKEPAMGRMEFDFTGTVLVIGSPKIELQGNIRKEYENKEFRRQVFNGSGKIIISGEFQGVQFFGRNVSGNWKGWGLIRFYGEFDRDLNTGEYWYAGKENEKFPWGNYGTEAQNPKPKNPIQLVDPKPVIVPPKNGKK